MATPINYLLEDSYHIFYPISYTKVGPCQAFFIRLIAIPDSFQRQNFHVNVIFCRMLLSEANARS